MMTADTCTIVMVSHISAVCKSNIREKKLLEGGSFVAQRGIRGLTGWPRCRIPHPHPGFSV